ncbi:hypothetical protein ACIRJR_24570 [Streptomyces sp. NPDC102402]
MPASPAHAAPTLTESWEVLADGLHVQRLALHLAQLHTTRPPPSTPGRAR